jgi:hypothetical protein
MNLLQKINVSSRFIKLTERFLVRCLTNKGYPITSGYMWGSFNQAKVFHSPISKVRFVACKVCEGSNLGLERWFEVFLLLILFELKS